MVAVATPSGHMLTIAVAVVTLNVHVLTIAVAVPMLSISVDNSGCSSNI